MKMPEVDSAFKEWSMAIFLELLFPGRGWVCAANKSLKKTTNLYISFKWLNCKRYRIKICKLCLVNFFIIIWLHIYHWLFNVQNKKLITKGAMKMLPPATVTSDVLEEPLEARREKKDPMDMVQLYYKHQEQRESRRMQLEEERANREKEYHAARMETERLRQQLLCNQVVPVEVEYI